MPRIWRWFPVALYLSMMIALSSVPGSSSPAQGPGPLDWVPAIVTNGLHLPLYAGLAILWARALAVGVGAGRAAIVAALAAAAFGVVDELYQGLIPGRSPSVADWIADAVGAAAGAAVFLRLRRRGR